MAKFYGAIGYAETEKTSPGRGSFATFSLRIITERCYYGEILQLISRRDTSEHLNDNLNVSNKISIIADPFAYDNFHLIRYVVWMGAKWKVTNVEVQYPRLTLTMGGLYNE